MSYLTEEEARRQPCLGPSGCGRWEHDPDGTSDHLCIGSECKIAWRWGPLPIGDTDPRPYPSETTWEQVSERIRRSLDNLPPRPGYCGLAGRPKE